MTAPQEDAVYAEDEIAFELERYIPVFVSQWEKEVLTCCICRNPLEGPCVECQSNATATTWECYISWGECCHCFHEHCIQRWLKTRKVCPLDNLPWKEKQEWNKNKNHVVDAAELGS